ncbi:arylamine N-acetyltransferase family protein [Geothrix edaphica]|uniref:Arylamine N-acetyltransferase n=1 Tax=Geothrix edaphica TaxID=2927976 RepID=A0ABQ5Q0S0_9BACT|nr:arylamine N-acetyltransferase [Geothrix edaphica]GLH67980.1 arylamine N-acetyltransferase [Geothrix edaphica]
MSADLDLAAYLRRIGFAGALEPGLETLRALHFAHATTIPFENLDIQLGLPIRLDLASLQDKLVRRRRGGYCFEQNTLFLAVLRAAGFEAIPCEARVRLGAPEVLPRTHMLLIARLAGGSWLCDVGFGGEGLLHPVPLDGQAHAQFQNLYRVSGEGGLCVLQSRREEGWEDLYAFQPEARFPVDFEMANHYTSTHPESRFIRTLTAQLPGPEVRRILRNRAYAELRGAEVAGRELAPEEVIPILRDVFGLEVPAGARFRAFEG